MTIQHPAQQSDFCQKTPSAGIIKSWNSVKLKIWLMKKECGRSPASRGRFSFQLGWSASLPDRPYAYRRGRPTMCSSTLPVAP